MADHVSYTRLKDCFNGVFAYVLAMKRRCSEEQPEYDSVRQRISGLLEQSAARVRELQVDPRDYDDARFAVAAWVDEAIMAMPWIHRDQWQRNLLQSELYGSASAGEEFFERLNQLTDRQNAVREVYYYCLCLGFAGRYCHEGDEYMLDQLKKSTLRQLTGKAVSVDAFSHEPIFAHAYPVDNAREKPADAGGWTAPKVWLAATPPVVLVVIFMVYSFVLNGVADNVMARVAGG